MISLKEAKQKQKRNVCMYQENGEDSKCSFVDEKDSERMVRRMNPTRPSRQGEKTSIKLDVPSQLRGIKMKVMIEIKDRFI